MIIVDTNVILAFLLTRGITRRIISKHKDLFATPESCYDELWEHREKWNKNTLSDEELKVIIEKVKKYFVAPVKSDYYKDNIKRAEGIIKDKEDAPVLALALSIDNEGIWTYNTKHFDTEDVKKHVRLLGTKEVLKLYPLKDTQRN